MFSVAIFFGCQSAVETDKLAASCVSIVLLKKSPLFNIHVSPTLFFEWTYSIKTSHL